MWGTVIVRMRGCVTRRLLNGKNFGTSVALVDVSLSLRFNGHFPGEPALAGVY